MEIIINVALSVQTPQQLILLTCHSQPTKFARPRCLSLWKLSAEWTGARAADQQRTAMGGRPSLLQSVQPVLSFNLFERVPGEGGGRQTREVVAPLL